MKQTRVFSLLAAAAFSALSLPAAIIIETETNLATTNNNVGTAQAIPIAAFTSPAPANAFTVPGGKTATIQGKGGENDVDFYSFQNTYAGSFLYVDVDNGSASFDNIVALFNSAGTLIAWGDDTNPVDPGSANFIDSLVGPVQLTQVGTYFIAITEFPNYPSAALLYSETALGIGGVSVSGAMVGLSAYDFGGVQPSESLSYTIHATVVTPEPATFGLVGLALAAVGMMRRKR